MMSVPELLGSILVLSMLALMAVRAASPLAAELAGTVTLDLPMPLLFKALDQRVNILTILGVLILGSGLVGERWISHETFVFATVIMLGILLLPRRYRFTTVGVSPNRATFRSWSEFESFQVSGNVVRLEAAERFSSLRLYVAAKDREAVIRLLNRYLATKSPTTPRPRPTRRLTRTKGVTR
jgi:hypothetical protein